MVTKHLLILVLITFSQFLYAQKDTVDQYLIHFQPSFDSDLYLRFFYYSDQTGEMFIGQNPFIFVYDSLEIINENTNRFISYGSIKEIYSLLKSNFYFNVPLNKNASKSYRQCLDVLGQCCKSKSANPLIGTDGMPILYIHKYLDKIDSCMFWAPFLGEKTQDSFVEILELVEQNENAIVEKTVETIKSYIDDSRWNFKVISKNPLYIKVLRSPCRPSPLLVTSFVQSLPEVKTIYLDVTNYEISSKDDKDVSCIENEFHKKYKNIRWIIDKSEVHKFSKLIYKK